MRVACTFGPLLAVALRWTGALMILVALLAPDIAAAFGSKPIVQAPSPSPEVVVEHHEDGGACGEDEESFEELIDCGADLEAHLDEPWAIALLRTTEVRMTAQQCEELLADIWSQQSCSASGRECGRLLAGSVQPSGLEVVSSSASGHVTVAPRGVGSASDQHFAWWADERMPKSRDLLPPVPPPKLVVR